MSLVRRSGILLHPSSLPGRYGIGEFGPAATEWLEFLAGAEQSVWQMLPLNPVDSDGCPYQSYATLAGNTLFISVDRLLDAGLLDRADLADVPDLSGGDVDYPAAAAVKDRLLARAFANFTPTADSERFIREQSWWLDDFAHYMALRRRYGWAWTEWPAPLARREPDALARSARELAREIDYHRFTQYLFGSHYAAVREQARELGIEILGDVAMFVGTHSSDVWARPNLFQLDAAGRPTVVAGFPPDEFSRDGQVWGNALYRWDAMAAEDYRWWIDRVRRMADLFDIVRLDHFRGFHRYWAVPVPGDATQGHWQDGPGADLFTAIRKELADVDMIAEDLGPPSEDVQRMRIDAGIPGMRLLQFAFSGDENQHLPHHYPADCVAYTGTHDNDTTVGWWDTATADERDRVELYLGGVGDGICWSAARAIFGSVAYLAVLPMQDVLQLGSQARLNTPGRAAGNWQWRLDPRSLTPGAEFRLRRLTEVYGRDRMATQRRARGFTG
ncbi:4-alpha-glucanotransferase [Catellatospora tritici]|uniref:4-alpha-glucanotransferase n=1 Tax=Catellatospora tritici TaxID=2851566 RepID=UPI001C2D040E|nr:4-alpha-glucanotransferase [Catellatospora tritici]MBV1853525.1 4-alpha-glucanotransferase [Catellatospora tritici]